MLGDVIQQTQSGSSVPIEAASGSLPEPAKPGNILIAGISIDEKAGPEDQGVAGYPHVSTGWTLLAADCSEWVSVGVAYRIADGGLEDEITWSWEAERPHECAGWMLEIESGDGAPMIDLETHYTDGLKYPTMSFGPLAVAGGNGIAVAMVGAGTASSVADGPTLGSWDGGFEEQMYFHEPSEAENAGGSLAYKGVTDGEVIETTMTATDKTDPESELSGILVALTWPPPPPPPRGSQVWELLYESLGFHREDDPETGYQLRRFCEAELGPYQDIYDLLRERDDMPAPFALFLDPDRCPAAWLPYLAQYVGVVPTPEMSEQQLRAEIREPTGWRRGQLEAIRVATRRTLESVAGEELMVLIRPRTPEVGNHYIRTLLSQTPDPDRTKRVVRANVPAWEALDYAAIDAVTYADIRAAFPTYAALKAAFPTYNALREVLPTELPKP